MPEKKTMQRAHRAKHQGKAPTTQAGEFVREEIHHVREGKHGAKNPKQAIAIGLSKARRAGVALGAPKRGSKRTRARAQHDLQKGQEGGAKKASPARSRARRGALKRQGRSAASRSALSRAARSAAQSRPRSARRASAKRGARTRKSRASA